MFAWMFRLVRQIHLTITKTKNKLVSTKNCLFLSLNGPLDTQISQHFYKWLEIETLQPKADTAFYRHSQ